MYVVYILHSDVCDRFYIGHTQNIDNRLTEHNAGETKSIKKCIPWKLVWQQEVASRGEAMVLETESRNAEQEDIFRT